MNPSTLYLREDTIAALSTPFGTGAVAVIRISGNQAVPIVEQLFEAKGHASLHIPRQCIYGSIVEPNTRRTVDHVLCTAFHAPKSYTGEDVVEINCHGSPAVIHRILELLYQHGARPAEPGEFTFRAVCRGKMDIAQAEGVAALIESRSQLARSLSLRMLEGAFSKELQALKEDIVSLCVELETQLEFPDDAMEEEICHNLEERTARLFEYIQRIRCNAVRQQRFEQGIIAVLAGRPNVGKSSLFNRLLGKERAIVTPHPGTTRDSLEGTLELHGCPVTLIDTAGLRETQEEIEAIGVARSKQLLTTSHIILFVLEADRGITQEDRSLLNDIVSLSQDGYLFLVANKSDQIQDPSAHEIHSNYPLLFSSALAEDGMDALLQSLETTIRSMVPAEGADTYMITGRQERLLDQCTETLERTALWMRERRPMELIAEELKSVLKDIAVLDGTGIEPDIMSTVFSTFCIGK